MFVTLLCPECDGTGLVRFTATGARVACTRCHGCRYLGTSVQGVLTGIPL